MARYVDALTSLIFGEDSAERYRQGGRIRVQRQGLPLRVYDWLAVRVPIGLSSDTWQHNYWKIIFTITLLCSESKFKHAIAFIQELEHVLPCGKCRTHFVEYIKTHPIPTNPTQYQPCLWILEYHDAIKKMNT